MTSSRIEGPASLRPTICVSPDLQSRAAICKPAGGAIGGRFVSAGAPTSPGWPNVVSRLQVRSAGRPSDGWPASGRSASRGIVSGRLRRHEAARQMCTQKLRHVAPLRRMQGIIFRGADKLPEWNAESTHGNGGAFLQSHQYRRRDILLIERYESTNGSVDVALTS